MRTVKFHWNSFQFQFAFTCTHSMWYLHPLHLFENNLTLVLVKLMKDFTVVLFFVFYFFLSNLTTALQTHIEFIICLKKKIVSYYTDHRIWYYELMPANKRQKVIFMQIIWSGAIENPTNQTTDVTKTEIGDDDNNKTFYSSQNYAVRKSCELNGFGYVGWFFFIKVFILYRWIFCWAIIG